MRRAFATFVMCASGLLLVQVLFVADPAAQVAGRNVNMVTGGTFPGGDPFLAKQNELSLAISLRNHCHLLGSANDYRAVFLPGLPNDREIGDAWAGWYESTDCGNTWYSTLIPGYPQDNSSEGGASPAKGFTTAADPYVRAGVGGTFFTSFIVFNRGTTSSKLVVARFIDHNNFDAFIDPDKIPNVSQRRARSPFRYVGTTEVARRGSGTQSGGGGDDDDEEEEEDDDDGGGGAGDAAVQNFIDKPSMAVFPSGGGTCSMDGETVPATNVYVAWTEFAAASGNDASRLYFARSTDCARTFPHRVELTAGAPPRLSQGTQIAVNPRNPMEIYVVWRQIRRSPAGMLPWQDAIMFARSGNGGTSFDGPFEVPLLGQGQYRPFDQNTTSTLKGNDTTTFRTLGYPAIVFADDGPSGHLYLAVSQVPNPLNTGLGGANAHIVMTRTAGGAGGIVWDLLTPVVGGGTPGAPQQAMPALAYAAGKLQLIWYDVRYDEAGQDNKTFSQGPSSGQKVYDSRLIDDAATLADPDVKKRRTIDVLGAQAPLSLLPTPTPWPPAFNLYGIAQPDYNDPPSPMGPPELRGPRIAQYPIGDRDPSTPNGGARQLLFNRGGLTIYGGGTIPFMSDYIDITGISHVRNAAGQWVFNGLDLDPDDLALGTFQAGWTDNRDAKVGNATTRIVSTPEGPVTALNYVRPVPLPANATLRDAPDNCPADPSNPGQHIDNTQTRDANVYTSRITQNFSLTLPANARRTNTPGVIRTFAVQLANNQELTPPPASGPEPPEVPTEYELTLSDPSASFSPHTFATAGPTCFQAQAPLHEISVKVLPRSSITRTVFVTCGPNQGTPIVVTATQIDGPNAGDTASVVINGDPSSPPARDPNGNTLGPESHNPDGENPDGENPDGENPDGENPDGENPDGENPDGENPDGENPDGENPDGENPDGENPDGENPDGENASLADDYQDVWVDMTNKGNTTSGYEVQVNASSDTDTSRYTFQLSARRVYARPASINCYLVRERRNQTLFSLPLQPSDLQPKPFSEPDNGDITHATFLARPGESIRVMLRIVYDRGDAGPGQFCEADDPAAPNYCFKKLTFRIQAQAPNTGEAGPRGDAEGFPQPDLVVDGSLAAPAVAGENGIIDVPATTIRNAGNAAAVGEEGFFNWRYYISTDRALSASDDQSIGTQGGVGSLAPGGTIPFAAQRLELNDLEGISNGPHFYGVLADNNEEVDESLEGNNALVTSTPVDVKPYTANVGTPSTTTPNTSFTVTVHVEETGEGGDVQGANVTLFLEGPNTVDGVPGPINTSFFPRNGTTNADGNVTFTISAGLPAGSNYRFIAAVRISGVTPGFSSMRFQSPRFSMGTITF